MRTARRAGAAAAAIALCASLAGCSQIAASDGDPAACTPIATPGAASEGVTATGPFGVDMALAAPGPLSADRLEVSRSGGGEGRTLTEGGILEGSFLVAAAADGSPIASYRRFSSQPDGTAAPVTMTSIADALPGAAEALRCAQAGERLIAAMPASVLFGERGAASLGDPAETVIFAADVTRVYRSGASGRIQPPQDGIPAVVTAPDGRPGATMPRSAPPRELRTAVRVAGFGPPIRSGDALTLHFSIFDWSSGKEIGSTWDPSNAPMRTTAGAEQDGLYGLTSRLVGLADGSQLIAVVPTELALSASGPLAPAVASGRTLVLVIDVLGADAPESGGAG